MPNSTRKFCQLLLLVIILFLSSTVKSAPITFYVKANATGLNNGDSWVNAYTKLDSAILRAIAGDSIKVAAGTYSPSAPHHYIIKDSTIILGGYPNFGNPSNADRNWSINQTILSGLNFMPTIILAFGNLTPYTQLDGFIIEKCFNDGSTNDAAGISITNSDLSISNCIFRDNRSQNVSVGGAGLACRNGKPTFTNCFFIGGINSGMGSIYCVANSAPIFYNCVFANNSGNTVFYSNQSNPKLYNCIFLNNRLSGFFFNPDRTGIFLATNNSNLAVYNSIFFGNKYGHSLDSADIVIANSTLEISNTITQNYTYGSPSLLSLNPKFKDTASIAGPDGFYFTSDDGLQLTNPCSHAINKGDNNSVSGIAKDILGNNRIVESVVDLGPYEMQSNLSVVPSVLYVNSQATGLNNGSSWTNAYTNLQSAFMSCSDTIKVAKGTYFPSENDIHSSFWLENKRTVLGGYPNTGSPGNADRNVHINETILSGDLPQGNGIKSYTLVHGKNVDSTALFDGFSIRDVDNLYNSEYAAAFVFSKHGNGIVRNTLFKNLISGYNAAASIMVKDYSNPKFINCIIDSTGAFLTNGYTGIGAVSNFSFSKPTFKNCIFKNNKAFVGNVSPFWGGAMYNNNASPIIDSCMFFKNGAQNYGGAIANFNYSNPIIKNSSFFGNYCGSAGSDIYNIRSSPLVINCLFSDSSIAQYGGAVANYDNSNPVFIKCEFNNSKAALSGGGAVCYNSNSSSVFASCVFTKCNSGKGIFLNENGGGCSIINSVLSENSGSFLTNFLIPRTTKVINSTIINNSFTNIFHDQAFPFSKFNVLNSIFWNNSFTKAVFAGYDVSNLTFSNCITQSFGPTGQNGILINVNPRFIDITTPAGPDNKWFTADDGIRLFSCSPAINAGQNDSISGFNEDILGNPRIINATVDIGAYEFQSSNLTLPRVFYVNEIASGLNDGSSWENAFTNLQSAVLNGCADTIKIAKGIYKPAVSFRDSAFNFDRGVSLYGGYPDSGNPTDADRNTAINPTVLSGDISIMNDSTDNSLHVLWLHPLDSSKIIVDGLTIEKAVANESFSITANGSAGAGILANGVNDLELFNCTFKNNSATGAGSGIALIASGLKVDKCIFINNNSANAATLTTFNTVKKTSITNSVFAFNKNRFGTVSLEFDAKVTNTLFFKNESEIAAGILCSNKNIDIVNCNFIKNNTVGLFGNHGRAVYVRSSSESSPSFVKIRNSVFKENTHNNFSSQIANGDIARFDNGNNNASGNIDTKNSACNTLYPFFPTNITSNGTIFKNIDNAIGNDNNWFTNDDGLISPMCSNTYNSGNNASVQNIPFDILGNARIMNGVVDMGAYEYQKPSAKITASDTLICSGTLVSFSATASNINGVPVYTWKRNSLIVSTNSNTYSANDFNNNDTVTVTIVTIDSLCNNLRDTAISNNIIIRLSTSIVPSVSIISSSTNICSGAQVIFTAIPINGSSAPSYQWKKNGVNVGTNSNQYIAGNLQNNDTVKLDMISGFSCANPAAVSSNSIVMSVTANPLSTVSIAASSSIICADSLVTFTATATNAGSFAKYKWKINGVNVGNDSNTFSSSSLNNNDTVNVTMLTNLPCAIPTVSNNIIITIRDNIIPAVSITTPSQSVCVGVSTTFTATPTNGTATSSYQWKKNGNNVGTNNPVYTANDLLNGDMISVILTSTGPCVNSNPVSSNTILMAVLQTPVSGITITGNVSVFQDAPTVISSSLINSSSPFYQWQDSTQTNTWSNITGATSPTLIYTAISTGDKLRCLHTNNSACASITPVVSNVLVFTVNPVTPATNTGVMLYPNPVSTSLTLDSLKVSDNWQSVNIININGGATGVFKSIVGQTKVTLDLSSLPAGIYLALLINKDGEKAYYKFIKV